MAMTDPRDMERYPSGLHFRGTGGVVQGRRYSTGRRVAGFGPDEGRMGYRLLGGVEPVGIPYFTTNFSNLPAGQWSVPESYVSDVGRWEWVAEFDGAWFRVGNVYPREVPERVSVVTCDADFAEADPGWEGDRREGEWARWLPYDPSKIMDVWVPRGERFPTVVNGKVIHG